MESKVSYKVLDKLRKKHFEFIEHPTIKDVLFMLEKFKGKKIIVYPMGEIKKPLFNFLITDTNKMTILEDDNDYKNSFLTPKCAFNCGILKCLDVI